LTQKLSKRQAVFGKFQHTHFGLNFFGDIEWQIFAKRCAFFGEIDTCTNYSSTILG